MPWLLQNSRALIKLYNEDIDMIYPKKFLSEYGMLKLWSLISANFVEKENGKGLFSGKYEDITGIPTKLSEFTNDLGLDGIYLSKTDASSTYLSKADAANIYQTKSDIASDYIKEEDVSSIYLSKTDAANTYQTKSDTTTNYLKKTDAADTYQTKTDASSTYQTKTDAANTYQTKSDTAANYLKKTDAADTYVKISDYDLKIKNLNDADISNLEEAKKYVDGVTKVGSLFQVVSSLPVNKDKEITYLVPKEITSDITVDHAEYIEHVWIM